MSGFSTLSNCPFNSNKIFIYKNYMQARFIDAGVRNHGPSKGRVNLFGNALYDLHLLCVCTYLATRFRPVKMRYCLFNSLFVCPYT